MNQNELLKQGKELLKSQNVEEYEIKAKRLLQFILKQEVEQFIIHSLDKVTKQQEQDYKKYLEEIIQGKPLQYITHKQEFMGLDFYVDENVLIPQPDTEILVEKSIEIINSIMESKKAQIQVLDLCTGSGAIAISIAKQFLCNGEHCESLLSNKEKLDWMKRIPKQASRPDRNRYRIRSKNSSKRY